MLSDMIPREHMVAVMQKRGGRIPSLPKRGGRGSKYFQVEGWSGTSPLFLEGRVTYVADRGGSGAAEGGEGPPTAVWKRIRN